jgi:hypothetical protein
MLSSVYKTRVAPKRRDNEHSVLGGLALFYNAALAPTPNTRTVKDYMRLRLKEKTQSRYYRFVAFC